MLPEINIDKMVEFLVGLLNTPSPTGDTDQAVQYVYDAFRDAFADLPLACRHVRGDGTGD